MSTVPQVQDCDIGDKMRVSAKTWEIEIDRRFDAECWEIMKS